MKTSKLSQSNLITAAPQVVPTEDTVSGQQVVYPLYKKSFL